MHTLHPEKKYAHDWFREIVQYAISKHIELPFLKDDDSKYVEEWLGDAMRELVLKVLSNDTSIAKDVRDQLEKELGDFMEKTGINKQWTIQKKADSIVEKMAVFTTEIGKLLVVVGNGLARASGVKRVFGLARDLVDKVVGKLGETVQKLARGLGYLTVVSINIPSSLSSSIAPNSPFLFLGELFRGHGTSAGRGDQRLEELDSRTTGHWHP